MPRAQVDSCTLPRGSSFTVPSISRRLPLCREASALRFDQGCWRLLCGMNTAAETRLGKLALHVAAPASITAATAAAAGGSSSSVVCFKTPEAGAALQLHVFTPPGYSPTDARPAAVFFFGGGWLGGAPTQFFPHCEWLSQQRGMVAISCEYRTASSHDGATPFDCVADGRSAMRWVRSHAAELGVDPHRIAAGGGSAGGHVAAATATCTSLDDAHDDMSVDPTPNALLLFNPVYDNGPVRKRSF